MAQRKTDPKVIYIDKCKMCKCDIKIYNIGRRKKFCKDCRNQRKIMQNSKFKKNLHKDAIKRNNEYKIKYLNEELVVGSKYSTHALCYIFIATVQEVNNLVFNFTPKAMIKQIIIKHRVFKDFTSYQIHSTYFYEYDDVVNKLKKRLKNNKLKQYHNRYRKWLKRIQSHKTNYKYKTREDLEKFNQLAKDIL